MQGICVGGTSDLSVDEGCSLTLPPIMHTDQHHKRLVRIAYLDLPGVFRPTFHYDCSHNQLRSVVGRVIGVVPKPSTLGIQAMVDSAARLALKLPFIPPQDILAMPARYGGAKRKRYEEAVDKFLAGGVHKRHSYCSMFVKAERFNGHAKVNPDPRAIQFRGAIYCVALAQFLQPIEHYIYNISYFSKGVPMSRNIAKGLNSVDRAELLALKMSHFRRPVVASLDASRFDKHVSVHHLAVEHSIYRRCNPDKFFRKLLSMQMTNKVFCSSGIKYIAKGRRMSGDMNTALGNCLIMLLMVDAYIDFEQLLKYDTLDDGDDCLLLLEYDDLERVLMGITRFFLEMGMQLKVENVAFSLFNVVFCQSSVVEFSEARFKFVRDYRAVISKAMSGIRHWQDPKYRIKVLQAIGMCELVLNLGVPVLQSFATALLRNVGRPKDYTYASDGLKSRVGRELKLFGRPFSEFEPVPIADCARQSFAIAFGCPVEEQLFIESFFSSWTFTTDATFEWGSEWDVYRWLPFQSWVESYHVRQDVQLEETKQARQAHDCQTCATLRS